MNLIGLVALSGGMDSLCLLLKMLASQKYQSIECFGFNYGQRHVVELEKASKIVEFLKTLGFNVSFNVMDLTSVFNTSQSSLGALKAYEVPKGEEYNVENMKSTVVENRNVVFSSCIFSKALALSKLYDKDVHISLGVHKGDDTSYPDCRPQSIKLSQKLYKISNFGSERITYISPFVNKTKSQVLKEGLLACKKLGIDKSILSMSSSCYDPTDSGDACKECSTCKDRLKAFEDNKVKDLAFKNFS